MPLPKNYQPAEVEPQLEKFWQESGIYHFDPQSEKEVYSIDTPPATVSGHLHLGHVYSYSHADFMARFFRMNGKQVFYPMGFDDNGLPTERLVEKRLGVTAAKLGRQAFIQKCLEVSEEAEQDYRALWQRLGLSIDWRYTYRTIDDLSRRDAQLSFLDLYQQRPGLPPESARHLVPGMPHRHCPGRPERPGARQRVRHPAIFPAGWAHACPSPPPAPSCWRPAWPSSSTRRSALSSI